jgi:hypothetical protein
MRPSAHQLRWGYSTVSDFEWLPDPTDPKSDTRPIQVLIATALSKPDEELTYWNAVAALQWRGTLEVFNRADGLCQSPCSVERRLGADILGQLGCPDRSFPKGRESVSPLAIEAATLIAIPQLIKELIALRGRWDGDTSLLELAIQACLPDPCLGVSGASEKGVLAHPEGGHG